MFKNLKVGMKGLAAFDLRTGDTVISKGSIVKISNIDKSAPSWSLELKDDQGNKVILTRLNSFIPIIILGQNGTASYDIKSYDSKNNVVKIVAKEGTPIQVIGFAFDDENQRYGLTIRNLENRKIIFFCSLDSIKPD